MFSEQTKLILGMLGGILVEPGKILSLTFPSKSNLMRFLAHDFQYRVLYEDRDAEVVLEQSPYVNFSKSKFSIREFSICAPYELEAVPNEVWITKQDSGFVTSLRPQIHSSVKLPADCGVNFVPNPHPGQSTPLASTASGAKRDFVIERKHLRLLAKP